MKHSIILIVFLFFGCASINKQIISTDKNTMYQESFSKQSEITNEDKCIDFAGTVEDFLQYAKINSGKNNLGVMINASTVEKAYYVELGGIKYLVVVQDGKLIYQRTDDENFFTKDRLSINNTVNDFVKLYGKNIYYEVGCDFYIPIENGWRAVISFDGKINYSSKIQFFYQIDSRYSRTMPLDEWNAMYNNFIPMEEEDLPIMKLHFIPF